MHRHRSLLLGSALLLTFALPAAAQTIVTTTQYKVRFDRIDSLQALIKGAAPVLAEAKRRGGIVDQTWLIHLWGGEYNVVDMLTWKNWTAMADTTLSMDAATRTVYPDSTRRKRVEDAWAWVFDNGFLHVDNIYRKVE